MPVALLLVRHAKVQLAAGLCYGALEAPVDALANAQAALKLAPSLPAHAQLAVSPRQRCQVLAQQLQLLRPDVRWHIDWRLAEMNFGCYEGQPWAQLPAAAFEAWLADFWQHRFGGAESVAEFMTRVASAWDELEQLSAAPVWLTHAGVIRAASLLAQGVRRIDQAQQWPQLAPDYGQSLWLTLPHLAPNV